tara:strand:+ start:5231 stop:7042 length:1812 start_codon:yes stop_codon:yes gene_type:complete
LNQIKLKTKQPLMTFIHILSLTISFLVYEIYFFSSKGVDYPVYRKYVDYFIYNDIEMVNNHGLIYYYINSLVVYLRKDVLNSVNEIVFFSNTIQLANFLFYIIGIFGIYKLLVKYNYKKNHILISLSLLHWVPKIIEMRVLLKPEIIGFAFLPWLILGIDDYFENNKILSLIISLFPLSLLVTSKGSIAGMILLFMVLKYIKNINVDNFKILIILFVLFLIICIGVGFENFEISNLSFFEVVTSDNYQNKAEISFLTNINIYDLIFNPEIGYHNNSFIGITLLDTFGDYYKVNLGSEDNYFVYNKVNFFENSDGKSYIREFTGMLLTILFYFAIYYFQKRNKKIRIILLSPFIGMLILLMNSFGFPDLNFDPTKGDTMKPSYYSFFIALAFVFIICELLKNFEWSKKIFPITLFVILLFTIGFPKSNYQEINDNVDSKIQISLFCNVLTQLNSDLSREDCSDEIKKSCEYNLFANEAQNISIEDTDSVPNGYTRVYRSDTILGEIIPDEKLDEFINEGGYSLTPVFEKDELKYLNPSESLKIQKENSVLFTSDVEECINYYQNGYRATNDVSLQLEKIPYVNLIYLFFTFYLIFKFSYLRKKT